MRVGETEFEPSSGADEPVSIEEAELLNADGEPRSDFESSDPCTVRLRCGVNQPLQDVTCRVTVRGDYGPLFSVGSEHLPQAEPGRYVVECALAALPLLPGLYRVDVELCYAGQDAWLLPRSVAAFRVTTPLEAFGSQSVVGATKSRGGFLAVPYRWRLEDATGAHQLPGLHQPSCAPPR